ncbi:hypothetical protein DRJ16_07170, partial [Candidatus Woesearchaeota archaeon]
RGADADIVEILERINSLENFFTTSSCSGRIVLLKVPHAGSKRDAEFVAKWHRSVSVSEVLDALSKACSHAISSATAKAEEEEAGEEKTGKTGKTERKAGWKTEEEKAEVRTERACEEIWLIEQPPIIHVACKDMHSAEKLLQIAYNSGFKYSSLKSMRRFVVEILSTERMDVPLCACGRILITTEYIKFLVSRANFLLNRGKNKLKRLLENLERY